MPPPTSSVYQRGSLFLPGSKTLYSLPSLFLSLIVNGIYSIYSCGQLSVRQIFDFHPPSLALFFRSSVVSRPGWKFQSLLGSQSVVCGIQQQHCSSTNPPLPPTCSMTFLWAVFIHFLDCKRHDAIWRQCICAAHSKQSMWLNEVHVLTCIKPERYREEQSAILILLDPRCTTQKSLEFNPCKGKGTKPQRAGSLSTVFYCTLVS